jgi:hypothetical protein
MGSGENQAKEAGKEETEEAHCQTPEPCVE